MFPLEVLCHITRARVCKILTAFLFQCPTPNFQSDAEMKRLKKYHTQQYVNGSKCDISGKLRNTEVRVSRKTDIKHKLNYIFIKT